MLIKKITFRVRMEPYYGADYEFTDTQVFDIKVSDEEARKQYIKNWVDSYRPGIDCGRDEMNVTVVKSEVIKIDD